MSELRARIAGLPMDWSVARFGDVLVASRSPLVVNKMENYREIPMFRPLQPDTVDVEFLRRFFLTDRGAQFLAEASPGGAGRNRTLNQKFLADTPIPLPPLPEQQKIAAILSAVDEVIEKTEAVIEGLQMLKKAMIQELLTRGLPGRHTGFRETVIGEVPERWDIVRLLDVAALPSGQVDPRSSPYRQRILVAPNHIETATGRLLQRETAEAQGAISGKYSFKQGDVIYSKIRPYLRKAWLATFDGICSADMYPMRPSNRIQSGYLLATLLSERFTDFASSVSMRTGIPKINREELAEYSLALPSLDEQKVIEQVLFAADDRLNSEAEVLQQTRNTKAALMSVLLTGELRVTPDEYAA
jgi:type I restriction enzyme, S subunit